MHNLEVPFELAGHGVERNDGIAEEVVALAIESVVIARWAAEDGVERAAFRIQRHVEAPVVRAGAILPAVGRPGVVAGLAGLRDGMKFPNLRTRARIVGARVAGLPRCRLLRDICADE